MKSTFVATLAVTLLFSFNAKASDEASRNAAGTLLRENPVVESQGSEGDEAVTKVGDLVGRWMLSSFNKKGAGSLSVVTNECKPRGRAAILDCKMTILNSDRQIKKDGSYAPAKGMTESMLQIQYSTDLSGENLHSSQITSFFAG